MSNNTSNSNNESIFSDQMIEKVIDGGGDRYMCMWSIEDIAPQMKQFIENYKKA